MYFWSQSQNFLVEGHLIKTLKKRAYGFSILTFYALHEKIIYTKAEYSLKKDVTILVTVNTQCGQNAFYVSFKIIWKRRGKTWQCIIW